MNEASESSSSKVSVSFNGNVGVKLSPFGAGYVRGRDMYIRIPLVVSHQYKDLITSKEVANLVITTLREQYPCCRVVVMHESDGTPVYGVVKDMGVYPTVILRYVVSVFYEAEAKYLLESHKVS